MNIGSKIKLIRQHEGLTQQELADASGVGANQICNYEKGYNEPSYFKAECLLNAMGYGLKVVRFSEVDNDN